jgi:hypothetical protein
MSYRSMALLVLVQAACTDPFLPAADGGAPVCKAGEARCDNNLWVHCVNGQWVGEDCTKTNQVCTPTLGCRLCDPGTTYCNGLDVMTCNGDGTAATKKETCRPEQQCLLGKCLDYCDLPQKGRSNVGCEFWAVDLPNEYYCMSIDGGVSCLVYGCAACQQFAVAVANTSDFKVRVLVEQNDAAPGQPLKLSTVMQKEIAGRSLEVFNLPMREVDCSEWAKDASGKLRRKTDSQSCLSSRAYRLKSNYPVVAYQFNPIINDFSNGASLLIPKNGLDNKYLVMGWSTSNPIAMPIPGQAIEGTPDYTNVTVIGIEENTEVQVTVTHPTQGSKDGKVTAAKPGETVKVTLGPFDVLNLNSIQDLANITGDLTGTRVTASRPVAVFSGAQRGSVPGFPLDSYNPKPPEPSGEYKVCCTEHMEQQLFPLSSLGTNFVITRTPVRSTTVEEPDFYRILAAEDGTKVTTSLPNFPSFTLQAGKHADFWATGDFIVQSAKDKPIMVAQYAVAQGFLDNWSGAGGDPEFVIFPPVEQYRQEYLFLTPPTFDKDYVIIGAPQGAVVKLDGTDVGGEFNTTCPRFKIGTLDGESYLAIRCPVADGVHRLESSKPVGIMVYGYYAVGSYGYPGGADVKQINID